MVPVLSDADAMDFAGVERGNRAVRAACPRLARSPSGDLTGGTFSITNGGVFGSLLSTPIVNAPQSAILGMHKTQQRAMVIDGEVVARPMMYLALSYDHRIIDGKEAVQFLGDGQGLPGGYGPHPAWSLNMAEARPDYDLIGSVGGPAGYPPQFVVPRRTD